MKDVVVSEVGRNKMANFKCWACISQVRDIEEEFPHIKLDCQSIKDMEKVCYLDDIIRARSYTVGDLSENKEGIMVVHLLQS